MWKPPQPWESAQIADSHAPRVSGQQQDRRHVRGGRREPRNALYMAALAAFRWNDLLRVFHHLLREDRLWALDAPSREVLA